MSDQVFLLFQSLKVGMVMLGCVRELSNFEVVLGLPNGLKGYMPISSICDAYTKILSSALDSGVDLEVTGLKILLDYYVYNIIIIIRITVL